MDDTIKTLATPIDRPRAQALFYIMSLDMKLSIPEWARIEEAFVAGYAQAMTDEMEGKL